MVIEQKVFVITGGGNGIGRELVLNLLSRGAKVAAVDINRTFLDQTVALAMAADDALSIHTVDITDQKAVEALAQDVLSKHGAVDAIINCAGIIQPFIGVNELNMDIVDMLMKINFGGDAFDGKGLFAPSADTPGAYIVNNVQHGRLSARPRTDDLWGVQGSD